MSKNNEKYYIKSHRHQEKPINHKIRFIYLVISLVASAATTVLAIKSGLNPPIGFLVGCLGANIAVVLLSLILKIPTHLYVLSLIFVYLASPLGSIMNFYRSIDQYDKIVHFFSGILIAAFGWLIITKLMPAVDGKTKFIACMFAFFFASAGAGLWEIFEFVTDKLAGGEMQRGMVDTVTDMIAGNIGGIIYAIGRGIKK